MENNSTPLLSVIILTHNSARFLDNCFKSISCQTYKNLELIFIDASSTDDTNQKIAEFTAEKRAKHIVIENQGVGTSRNEGLKLISGEYFTFLDSDDVLSPCHFENLLRLAIDNGAEMSCCLYKKVNENKAHKYIKDKKIKNKPLAFGQQEAMQLYFAQKKLDYVLWNKVYKTSTLQATGAQFLDKTRFGEESYFIYTYFKGVKKVVFSPVKTYFYVQRKSSIMHEQFNDKRLDIYKNIQSFIKDCEKAFPEVAPYVCSMRSGYSCAMLWLIKKHKYQNAIVINAIINSLKKDCNQLKKCKKTALYRRLFIPLVPWAGNIVFKRKIKNVETLEISAID